jgi:nucleoside-diphosphate kinase
MKSIHFFALFTAVALQVGLIAQSNSDYSSASRMQTPQVSGSYSPSQTSEWRSNQKMERTLSILKPDALRNRHIGEIISRFEKSGLHVIALKMVKLTPTQAAQFYSVHRDRPFFADLVKFMSSGPVVVMVLEGDQAISRNRQLMGATNPKNAEKGTIRADFAESVTQNAVHGSDSPETAQQEIAFFFSPDEIYSDH